MDVKLVDNGSGGDLLFKDKGFELIFGFQNMPYLAMFGGNVEASTKETLQNEQSFDFWANKLLFPLSPAAQFNSETERALIENPLTSSGRIVIENAVKSDLEFMRKFCEVKVSSAITSVDKIEIKILITEPDNLEAKEYVFLWDSTKQELTIIQ